MATGFYQRPSGFGYWRGSVDAGLAGPSGGGKTMPGSSGIGSMLSAGQGAPGSTGWNPTVVYLLVLIVAEMIVFGFISRMLR